MTLSHPVKVTQHISRVSSYSSFWSQRSTAKQQPRPRCLTYLKILLLQQTLQPRSVGPGLPVTSSLSRQEAPGRGSEAAQAPVPTPQPVAHLPTSPPVTISVLENPPLPSVGLACTLHLPCGCIGTFLSSRNTLNWSTECRLLLTWHKEMQLF